MKGPSDKETAGFEFLSWLKRFSPPAYSAVMSQIGSAPGQGIYALNELNGLGQVDPYGGIGVPTTSQSGSSGASIFDYLDKAFETATAAIPAYFQYETQKDLMELNIERAKNGLPPIDPGVVAPQVKVIHDVPPAVQQSIADFKLGGQNLLLWGGLGLAAFFLFRFLR